MCRIAGIINKRLSKDELVHQIKAMTDLQKHGGPDDEGFFIDENTGIALGHRRLALLDLSPSGHQPMFVAEGAYGIIFNGEIYNFKEIRSELELIGYTFNSSSDTEVILQAFAAWGVASFNKLKGMFAFALLDRNSKSLYLVRDAQGIKPLYYYQKNNLLVFASEVKAFNTFPFARSKNPDWPTAFLSFGHLPEPMTTLQDVFMLSKGHYLKVDLEKNTSNAPTNYYQISKTKLDLNIKETQQQLNQILDQAIQKQLVADAPIGVFLSGGIDSSLLALQAAHYQKEQLVTVSLHFPEAKYSEKKYQEIISKQLPGKHIAQEINKKDFENYFDEILEAMDQPSTDGINSWFVSKAAHDAGLKAVLSGIGADELFGGYPSFKRMKQIPVARKFNSLIALFGRIKKNDALQRVDYLKHTNNTSFEYLFLRGFFNTAQLAQLFSISKIEQYKLLNQLGEPSIEIPKKYNGARAAWYEQHYFMQNQLLKDADGMSMQHGLEIRVPFLDQDLVEFAGQIPAYIIFDESKPAKHLLINAFDNLLPREIWDRPKMGFTFPFQYWLKEHPKYEALKVKHTNNFEMQKLFSNYESDKVHWSKIMSLLVLDKFEGSHSGVILRHNIFHINQYKMTFV